jgi:ribose transport system permease protein
MTPDGRDALTAGLRSSNNQAARKRRTISLPAQTRGIFEWAQRNGLFFALVILCLIFTLASDRFLTRSNLTVVLLQVAVTGMIAIPGSMLVLTGHVDLAVGSLMVMTSIIFGELMSSDVPLGLAIAISLVIALIWGIGTGYSIAYLGMSPIIVTLGGLAAARGVAQLISEGQTVYGFGDAFAHLGNGRILDTPLPVWLLAGAMAVGGLVWHGTRMGRHMTAVGSDSASAASLGVRVRRIPLVLYAVSALAAGVGGLIVTSQLDGSSLSIGRGIELEVLTAILLGGVSFTGGRGTLYGVAFGLLFIGVLANGLILVHVSPFWKEIAIGAALFVAAGIDVIYRRLERIPINDPATEEASE